MILRYGHLKFFFLWTKKSSKEGLEVATPENRKWKKYIRQSENANGSPLEPLWGSKNEEVAPLWSFENTILGFLFWEKVI